jgi:rhodanese-related sulfurtransferase
MRAAEAASDTQKSEAAPRLQLATCGAPLDWKGATESETEAGAGRLSTSLCAPLTSPRQHSSSRWCLKHLSAAERCLGFESTSTGKSLCLNWGHAPHGYRFVSCTSSAGNAAACTWHGAVREQPGSRAVLTAPELEHWSVTTLAEAAGSVSFLAPQAETSEHIACTPAAAHPLGRAAWSPGLFHNTARLSLLSDQHSTQNPEFVTIQAACDVPEGCGAGRWGEPPACSLELATSPVDEQPPLKLDVQLDTETRNIATSFIEDSFLESEQVPPIEGCVKKADSASHASALEKRHQPWTACSRACARSMHAEEATCPEMLFPRLAAQADTGDRRADSDAGLGARTLRMMRPPGAFCEEQKAQDGDSTEESTTTTTTTTTTVPSKPGARWNHRLGSPEDDSRVISSGQLNWSDSNGVSGYCCAAEQQLKQPRSPASSALLEPCELASYLDRMTEQADEEQRRLTALSETGAPIESPREAALQQEQCASAASSPEEATKGAASQGVGHGGTHEQQRTAKQLLVLDVRPRMSFVFEHIRHAEHLWVEPDRYSSDEKRELAFVRHVCKRVRQESGPLDLVVLYDHCTESMDKPLSIAAKLVCVLNAEFALRNLQVRRVCLLRGGFTAMSRAHHQHIIRVCDDDIGMNLCAAMRTRVGPLFERLLHQFLHERAQPASRILPYLYVGSERDASDWSFLQFAGITHILVVGSELRPHFPGALTYKQLPALDSSDEALDSLYPAIFAFIDESRRDPDSTILVHCYAGISRSVSAVLAYLVYSGWTLSAAWELMRERRSISRPNLGFWRQLMAFEKQRHGVQTLLEPPCVSTFGFC